MDGGGSGAHLKFFEYTKKELLEYVFFIFFNKNKVGKRVSDEDRQLWGGAKWHQFNSHICCWQDFSGG